MLHQLQFLKSILVSNFTRLNYPLKISLTVTYKCNLRCKMCNIWKREHAPELSVSEIDEFFRKADQFHWVGITGGEPFLRQDLLEIYQVILRRSKRLSAVHVATNGQLMERTIDLVESVRRQWRNFKLMFTVSIDGPPDLHDEIRGRPGAWQKAVRTFAALNQMPHVKAQIGFTLSSHNLGKFEETFHAIKQIYPKLRFDDMNVNIFQKSAIYYENQDMPHRDQEKLVEETRKILAMDRDRLTVNNFLRRTYLKLYPKHVRTRQYPIRCQALSSTCFMDPYGNLYPCPVYDRKLLNIRDMHGRFEEAWNSDLAREISLEAIHNQCPSCWSPCDAYSAIAGSLIPALFHAHE